MTLGLDLLGMAQPNFPHKMVLNHIKKLEKPFSIGCFAWDTFGDRKTFIERLQDYAELRNCKLIRVHAYWSDFKERPPLDDRLCPLPLLRKVSRVMQNFAREFPPCDFYLSHTAEYFTKNKKAVLERIRTIKDIAPNVTPVNNPINGILAGRGVLEERHHDIIVGAGRGVSLDGKDAKDVKDLKRFIANNRAATYTMLWIHSFNLRENGVTPPPRPDRTIRTTKKEMEWLLGYF